MTPGQSSTLATYFSKMAKFSIFGKFSGFFFHYSQKTSKKQVFQPRKKVTMLWFPKPKPTFTAYFLATFDLGKKFDLCVFNLRTDLFSIFGKDKI